MTECCGKPPWQKATTPGARRLLSFTSQHGTDLFTGRLQERKHCGVRLSGRRHRGRNQWTKKDIDVAARTHTPPRYFGQYSVAAANGGGQNRQAVLERKVERPLFERQQVTGA